MKIDSTEQPARHTAAIVTRYLCSVTVQETVIRAKQTTGVNRTTNQTELIRCY